MTDPAQIARGLLILAVTALSGCAKHEACVEGELYIAQSNDVYVRDEKGRSCVNKSEIAVRAELERNSHE